MTRDTLIVTASIFASLYVLSTIAYLMFRRYMHLRELELHLQSDKLDDFRAHLERQLMELNSRFSSSDDRWKELNHLVIAGQEDENGVSASPSKVRPSRFLRAHGIEAKEIHPVSDLIFVLTPFHED